MTISIGPYKAQFRNPKLYMDGFMFTVEMTNEHRPGNGPRERWYDVKIGQSLEGEIHARGNKLTCMAMDPETRKFVRIDGTFTNKEACLKEIAKVIKG